MQIKCENSLKGPALLLKDYLAVHMRKHVGVKRKTCPQCGKGLSDHNSLLCHTIAVHSESGTADKIAVLIYYLNS